MATPAEHIHPTSQSTPHSCPEKCYYKWHKSQIEDFVHKKHESWGKKNWKKNFTTTPLTQRPTQTSRLWLFLSDVKQERMKKRGELFPNRRLQPTENLHYHQYCWRRNDTGWHYRRYSKSKELHHSHLWSTRDRAAGRGMLVQTTHASKPIKIK